MEKTVPGSEISLLITGDYCPINRMEEMSQRESYDQIFNDFLPVVKSVDFAITNLEAPVLNDGGKAIDKTGPALKVSSRTLSPLVYAGFKMVTLANNHIMDFGTEGLQSTVHHLDKSGLLHVGAGVNLSEESATRIVTIKGKRIAFINIAENEFIRLQGRQGGANPLDLILNYHQIVDAKKVADYVIVISHGGHEMYRYPSHRMKKTFRFFVDCGADAVINHHTHCVSGFEVYKDAPIFYSLGNFIFDNAKMERSMWNSGLAVRLLLADRISFELVPVRQFGKEIGVRCLNNHELEDFHALIEELNKVIMDDDKLKMKFDEFVVKKSKMYMGFIEPFSSRLISMLRNRSLMPTFLSKRKKLLYTNLMRCESHRDVVIKMLENEIGHSS